MEIKDNGKPLFSKYQDNDCYGHHKPMDGEYWPPGKVLGRNGAFVSLQIFTKCLSLVKGI